MNGSPHRSFVSASTNVSQRLALGTVQFGMAYGVANRAGRVARDEAAAILAQARGGGIDTLDTAIAYGDSECRLGEIGVRGWKVISKLPPLPERTSDVRRWVDESVSGSLARLGVEHLHGLLLHRSQDLAGPNAEALHDSLSALKAQKRVSRIGVSIYAPEELEPICGRFEIDLVQAPFNVLDRRLAHSGWLARLKNAGVEVHTRSAFLQGLLLMGPAERPAWFTRWQTLWDSWEAWLGAQNVSALQASLAFALSETRIDRVVVGVDSSRHLADILAAESLSKTLAPPPGDLASTDLDLVNPSRWSLN
jgi:aryl-alcohol dehydrogenase-like predicted oxidoreductase